MNGLKNLFTAARARLAGMTRTMRVSAALLAGLIVVGGLWLTVSFSGLGASPLNEPIRVADPVAAARTLDAADIAHRRGDGAVYVSLEHAGRARELLAGADTPADPARPFARIADSVDIWHTESQNTRRWQAEKMSALSRLIGDFADVETATVLFEPGTPRKLGQPEVSPTAAVNVRLAEGATMTPRLVRAIGDLISGSIPGMSPPNVRVVDAAGRSYRPSADAAATTAMEALAAAEDHYRRRIREALAHVDGLTAGVHVARDGESYRPTRAWVSVPRSHFVGIARATGRPVEAVIESRLTAIGRAAAQVIGADDPNAVTVDWRADAVAEKPAPSEATGGVWASAGTYLAIVVAATLLTGGVWLAVLGRRGQQRKKALAARRAIRAERRRESTALARAADHRPFAFLQNCSDDELISLLETEHPQTVALVLSRLAPPRAGGILAALPADTQTEAAGRIATLGHPDPEVVRHVAASLAGRLGRGDTPETGDDDNHRALAEILRHAGYDAESRILDHLGGERPELAGAVRQRIFMFEDVIDAPQSLLAAACQRVDAADVAIALRTAGEPLRGKVLKSLPNACAREIRRQMERIGPVRLSDVEAARQRVVDAVRATAEGQFLPVSSRERTA